MYSTHTNTWIFYGLGHWVCFYRATNVLYLCSIIETHMAIQSALQEHWSTLMHLTDRKNKSNQLNSFCSASTAWDDRARCLPEFLNNRKLVFVVRHTEPAYQHSQQWWMWGMARETPIAAICVNIQALCYDQIWTHGHDTHINRLRGIYTSWRHDYLWCQAPVNLFQKSMRKPRFITPVHMYNVNRYICK